MLRNRRSSDHDPVVPEETWVKFREIWSGLGEKKIDVAALVP